MSRVKLTTEEAIRELKNLIIELRELRKQANKTGNDSAKSLEKIEKVLKSIRIISKSTQTSFKSLQASIDKNTRATNANTAAQRSNRIATNQLTSAIYKKIRADKENNKTTKQSTENLKKMKGAAVVLTRAFGVIQGMRIFWRLLRNSYELLKQFDSIDFAMNTLIQSSEKLANSQAFLLDITESYGLEIVTTSQRYLKFLAAAQQVNLSLYDTQKIFRSVSKASATLGLKTDELTGVYLALEQMLSKGKVTTEELRRQLGERLPGAMGIMAQALDVSIPKLDEMLKKGEVLSAEALPKFAEALEDAYGIEAVNKVDTLVAAQNRLSNSWKIFIKNISDGSPIIKRWLTSIQNATAQMIKFYGLLLGPEEARLSESISQEMKQIRKDMDESSTFVVNARQKWGQRLNQIDEQIAKQRQVIEKQYNQKDINREKKKLEELFKTRVEFRKKVRQENIKWAKQGIDQLIVEQEQSKKVYEDAFEELQKLEKRRSASTGVFFATRGLSRGKTLTEQEKERLEELQKIVKESRQEYIKTTARLRVYKDLIEETFDKPVQLQPNKGKIDTSALDLEIAKIKKYLQELNAALNSGNLEIQDRLDVSKQIFKLELRLIETEYKKQIKLSRDNGNKKKKAAVEQEAEELKIKREYGKRREAVIQRFFAQEILSIKKKNDAVLHQELIDLRKRFEAIKNPTKKEIEEYQRAIAETTRKANNKTYKEQAAFLSLWLDSLGIHGEERIALERKILEILSRIKSDTDKDNLKKTKLTLQENLEMLRDFISSVSDLLDSLSARRLENIDAEIRAEEDKYDRLLKLAENDASKKEALEQQRQDKIAQLERKRLKEEQRIAKIRKAAAIAEVAINTAIAVSKVWSQTGIFGISAQIPVLLMGAIQTAAILAQPIPQYAEGIESVPKDQIAMINDGGEKEYVRRGNKILTTDTKNAIVSLKKNDQVYKNREDMLSDPKIYKKMNNIISTSKIKEVNYANQVVKGIKDGFKGAKIQNKNVVIVKQTSSYLKEKARFNG